ncbi:8644_t:CDS:1, partial [Rhizophagus irregularis]
EKMSQNYRYELTLVANNNVETLQQISRLPTPQVANNIVEHNFFNGTNFDGNNNHNSNVESLLLPAGWFVSSPVFP